MNRGINKADVGEGGSRNVILVGWLITQDAIGAQNLVYLGLEA